MHEKNPDWVFDDECPRCGEDVHLAAIAQTQEGDKVVKAKLECLIEETGCGHTWDWEADNE